MALILHCAVLCCVVRQKPSVNCQDQVFRTERWRSIGGWAGDGWAAAWPCMKVCIPIIRRRGWWEQQLAMPPFRRLREGRTGSKPHI